MQKHVAWLVLFTFFVFLCPTDFLKAETGPNHVVAQFSGKHVQWKVVFSPTGYDVKEEIPFDVGKGDVQVISSILNMKDNSKDLEKVCLSISDAKGRVIGADKDPGEAVKKLKLNPYPADPTFEKFAKGLKDMPKGKNIDLSKVVTDEESAKAQKEYARKLKGSKDVGFIGYGQKRYEGKGFKAMHMVNPTATGTWKMLVEGKKGDPFLAVALAVPLELTPEVARELKKGYEDIFRQLKSAYPNYHEWTICDSCCLCKVVVDILGVTAAIVGVIGAIIGAGAAVVALFVTAGTAAAAIVAAVGVLCAVVGLLVAAVGLATGAWGVATLIVSICYNCDWDCWVGGLPAIICYAVSGAQWCSIPGCCNS